MKKTIVLLVFAIVWQRAAIAQSDLDAFRGTWLYDRYLGFKRGDVSEAGLYVGYLSGVIDAKLLEADAAGKKAPWCQPQGAVMSQYFDIVGRYLEVHPELRQRHKVNLIVQALAESWPCGPRR
jgi:hypothetical protein